MPEIKLKHVVSFSSEDKVYKAENLLTPDTYKKWKCATPGEKNATVVLQFEKASQIHSIDIGNESSAFIEVLVGRSSDSLKDFQVLLVASSFMSPLESRNGTHTNRVRMFGPEKLSQKLKDEKWDCIQVVCTQPFNKSITYGLSFIKFHSPAEKVAETPANSEEENATVKLGAFKLKTDDDEDSLPSVGSLFGKKKLQGSAETSGAVFNKEAPSYAAAILASSSNSVKTSLQNTGQKRKGEDKSDDSHVPPAKKSPRDSLSGGYVTYKNVFGTKPENKKTTVASPTAVQKKPESKKTTDVKSKPSRSSKPEKAKKVPFHKIMEKVVFVLSGFVNPLRSELRDKALEMGASYKGDWDRSCTHLICAFLNTPKYAKVRKEDGRIVTKEWILDCFKKRTLLPWRDYMLGKYTKASSEEEELDEESEDDRPQKTNNLPNGKQAKNKVTNTPKKTPKKGNSSGEETSISDKNGDVDQTDEDTVRDDSETEDEDAIQDYIADTDIDSDSSGGDTEDEIRRVEAKAREKATGSPAKNRNAMSNDDVLATRKPDVSDLPLPELPNLFKQKHFFLYGEFDSKKSHDLQRYITAYNGVIEDYMNDKVKYVITEAKWDKNFDDAVSENEDLIFIKPLWIYKCHGAGKLLPYQPYIVIPDS